MGSAGQRSDSAGFERALHELAPAFGVRLESGLVDRLLEHYRLLTTWNRTIGLTSISSPREVAQFHYLESIYGGIHLTPQVHSLVDIGSGAGFPGFPIAVAHPDLEVVLIERQNRRAAFLEIAARQLGMENVSVFAGGFEKYRERQFDAVLCRAVERFSELLPRILRFACGAEQVLLFCGRGLADRCCTVAADLWETRLIPIPLSERRFIVSFLARRST